MEIKNFINKIRESARIYLENLNKGDRNSQWLTCIYEELLLYILLKYIDHILNKNLFSYFKAKTFNGFYSTIKMCIVLLNRLRKLNLCLRFKIFVECHYLSKQYRGSSEQVLNFGLCLRQNYMEFRYKNSILGYFTLRKSRKLSIPGITFICPLALIFYIKKNICVFINVLFT